MIIQFPSPLWLPRQEEPHWATGITGGLADGFANASRGRPQYPALLDAYGAQRPWWNVAGVDYRVGIPETRIGSLKPWQNIPSDPILGSQVNVNAATGITTFNQGFNVVFDGWDFSASPGIILRNTSGGFGAASVTFLNCKFGLDVQSPANNVQGGFWSFANQDGNSPTTVRYCEFYGDGMPNAGPFVDVVGSCTFEYNWCRHSGTQILSMDAAVTSITCTYRYNLIDDIIQTPGSHHNFLQWAPSVNNVVATCLFDFNTCYQKSPPQNPVNTAVGEGLQFNVGGTGTGMTFPNPFVRNNTMIALAIANNNSGSVASVSAMFHGGNSSSVVTGGTASNNFIDPTGVTTGFVFYTGTFIPSWGWTVTGTIDMTTGAIITPS